jgi:RNA polymerase sigma-70 factor (ECF subfamily)
LEPVEQLTAERIYERRWALTLLEQVLGLLEKEFVNLGNAALFAELQIFLLGEKNAPAYAVIAAKLGLTEGAVKAAVYRLRRRYRELLRQTIAQTVADPDEIDEELRHLFAVLVN